MKKFSTLVLLFVVINSCIGQVNPYSKTILKQANKMADILIKNKFKSFAKYAHPTVIRMMGGEEKMVATMKEGLKKMTANGTIISGVNFAEPAELFTVNNELQCTIAETLLMNVPGGKLIAHSTLIAISNDQGKNWKFVDTSGKSLEDMKKNFPTLSDNLSLVEWQKPMFIKE